MKTLLKTLRGRMVATLRNLLTLGAVLPDDEENDAWAVPLPGKVIPVNFAPASRRVVTQTR